MTGESDPFAAILALDEAVVEKARARNDEWGAKVRVVDDLAHRRRPSPVDCERLGLPCGSSGGAFDRARPTGGLSLWGPTRTQVRPLAREVIRWLQEREE